MVDFNPIKDIDWGEDPSELYRKLRFSLRLDQKARVAVLDKTIAKAQVHYGNFYYYCLGDDCPACIRKAPSNRYLSWILVYNVDATGKVLQPLGGVIKAWLFGRDKYGDLSGIKEEWGDLRLVDITVECTEEKYQRMSVNVARECLWQKDEAFAAAVVKMLGETKVPAVDMIAKKISREQVEGILNQRPELEMPGLDADVTALAGAIQQGTPDAGALQSLLAKLNQ